MTAQVEMQRRSTVCLVMIVRDEAHVIKRCLQSVRGMIDSYSIVDTGSTDDTINVIKECLKGIPGRIHERPWKNFGHNKTEMIELAKGMADYMLTVDADDVIVGRRPEVLTADQYSLTFDDGGKKYLRPQLWRSNLPFKFVGVLHEYLACDVPIPKERNVHLSTLVYRRYGGGGRSQVDQKTKYLRDAAMLEEALVKEPNNARYQFYLGQSYMDAGSRMRAIAAFERRAVMGDFPEEAFLSLHYIAQMTEATLNEEEDFSDAAINSVERAYLRAFDFRPTRSEPIFGLCSYLNARKRWTRSYILGRGALNLPLPDDQLFIDRSVYDWRLADVTALAAFYCEKKHEARQIWEGILRSGHINAGEADRIQNNLRFCATTPELSFATRALNVEDQDDETFGPFLKQMKKNLAAGGTELGAALTLFSLAVSIQAETIIEIGRYRGASTYALGMALRFLNAGWQEAPEAQQRPDVDYGKLEGLIDRRLYSIELNPIPEVREQLIEAGLANFVMFVDRPSSRFNAEDLEGRSADLIFIDGDHSYEGCLADVERFVPMLRPGGYFVLHDWWGWIQPDGSNGSPIKKVCDELIARGFEHLLCDTHYMSFMVFRNSAETILRNSPAIKHLMSDRHQGEKHWGPRPEVLAKIEAMIQPGWRVLEIGPGTIPFSKSTHFVERRNDGGQLVERPNTTYLDCNVDRLPFADKEFDFVYARHVVEDMFNPDLLLQEMNRVAKAGYIETPSPLVELTRGVDGGEVAHRGYIHHRWIVWSSDGALHFIEKATCVEQMKFQLPFATDPLLWNTYLVWEGELPFQHWQHDIHYKLHVDYGRVLDMAVHAGIASADAFRTDVR